MLRLFNTGPFYDTARATIAHACENNTRLIIDARSNGGGWDDPIVWLYRHLFDDGGAPLQQSGKIAFRTRTDPEIWNRFLGFASLTGFLLVEEFGFSPDVCGFLPEQQCWQDLEAEGQGLIPHTEVDWFEEPTVTEVRAGIPIPLSRKMGLGESLHQRQFGTLPPRDVSSCQGKFSGENLVILTDGANCSGGYVLLEPFIDNHKAIVVTMGGYVADPDDWIEVGTCRTGGSLPVDLAGQTVAEIEAFSGGSLTMEHPIPSKFARAVKSLMETTGFYARSGRLRRCGHRWHRSCRWCCRLRRCCGRTRRQSWKRVIDVNGIGEYSVGTDGFDGFERGRLSPIRTEWQCLGKRSPGIDPNDPELIVNDWCCAANKIVMESDLLGFVRKAELFP